MSEIDLEAPGFLFAHAKNCKDYTFLMMLKKPAYTKEALGENPNCVAEADLVFKSAAVADEHGEGKCDLEPQAADIRKKLQDKGHGGKCDLLVAVCTTSKPDNKDPSKREADVKPFTVKVTSEDLQLTALKAFVQPHEWIGYHTACCYAELKVQGEIDSVVLEVNPKSQPLPMITGVWIPRAPGDVSAKKYVVGGFGDTFGKSGLDGKFPGKGSWQQLWGQGASNGKATIKLPKGEEVFQIGLYPRQSGKYTLTASAKGITRKIEFGFQGNHPRPGD